MRYSVDAHAIGRHLTGNEVYVRSLLGAFASADPSAEFIAYISCEQARASVPQRITTRVVSGNPFVRLGRDLTRRVRKDRPDLLHVQYTSPLGCSVPTVVSVHDVSFLEHPEYFTTARAAQLKWSVRRSVQGAARILTGSEFSRRSIITAYGLDESKIVAVPNAASPLFRPMPAEAARQWARSRFSIAAPFILTVGDLQPRKNHLGLIRAFADLIRSRPELPHHLVMAGKETWYGARVRRAVEESGVAPRIHVMGFVEDEDLPRLYNACEVFLFPSFYEGFGLPVLEAMACGRAVACSNTSALPEVADAAALLFDPGSTAEIGRAMLDLLSDAELRRRMERLGQQRAALFSWNKTAEKTLDVYAEVVSAHRNRVEEPVTALRI